MTRPSRAKVHPDKSARIVAIVQEEVCFESVVMSIVERLCNHLPSDSEDEEAIAMSSHSFSIQYTCNCKSRSSRAKVQLDKAALMIAIAGEYISVESVVISSSILQLRDCMNIRSLIAKTGQRYTNSWRKFFDTILVIVNLTRLGAKYSLIRLRR